MTRNEGRAALAALVGVLFWGATAVAGPPTVEQPRGALTGQKQKIGAYVALNPDCSSAGQITVTIVQQPAHGTLSLEAGQIYPDFPFGNVRSRCNTREVEARLLFYTSEPGYKGGDAGIVEALFPAGALRRTRYIITVR